jgi:hypothetical protein
MTEENAQEGQQPEDGQTPEDAGETPVETGAAAEAGAQGEGAQPGAVAFPYAAAGAAFTSWFNGRLRRLPNPVIRLGAKTATVIELHPDGRLECSLHASAGEAEETFVAFEASHLDQLLLKFAAQGA